MFEKYKGKLSGLLTGRKDFQPFPPYENRAYWDSLPEEFRRFMIQKGESLLSCSWPAVPASVYMDFCRNGNRTRYEDIIFNGRRLPLQYLVMAECCEGKGRFLDDIINGIWAFLDEATWILPAHNMIGGKDPAENALPETENPDDIYVDLFSAECGAVLSWVCYMLGDRLGQEAKQIPARLLGSLNRRIFYPFLKHRDFPWMGYDGRPVNNWNPWILSNIMTAAGFACTDEEMRTAIIEKCLECAEYFVNGYAPDGGCDEGPGYWDAAGAALYDCVDILADLTDGKADLRKAPLIQNICSYIYKMHITGEYFVNFADCSAKVTPAALLICRMGAAMGDSVLKQFGTAWYQKLRTNGTAWNMNGCGCHIYRTAKNFLAEKELAEMPQTDFPLVRDTWFAGIQVMSARQQQGSDGGLYLAAKGGHNAESHNHNDVGSFVLYCDGCPAVIDIGTGVYERKTFSPQRYEILQMQSFYHNLPVIGGFGQLPGREFAAKDVCYTPGGDRVTFSLELKDAYPQEAGIESFRRSFFCDRTSGKIEIQDSFLFSRPQTVSFTLMTAVQPIFTEKQMNLNLTNGSVLQMHFDPALLSSTELFDTSADANLFKSWGKEIFRSQLSLSAPCKTGKFSFIFEKL